MKENGNKTKTKKAMAPLIARFEGEMAQFEELSVAILEKEEGGRRY